jgi:Uma2 family endonuclease
LPDVAIEVIWTSGGLDKLEIYKAFGVREVWIWQEGHIEVHALRRRAEGRADSHDRSGEYEIIEKSEILPNLDLAPMAALAQTENQTEAVRAFRKGLRE